MAKDFTKWHKLKIKLENRKDTPFFHEEDIWWCSIGINLGYEEDGKNELSERPVLILRKFSKDFFWGIPLTSQKRKGRFYYRFTLQGRRNIAMLSQLRLLSSKRLIRRMGKMPSPLYKEVESRITKLVKKAEPFLGGSSGALRP